MNILLDLIPFQFLGGIGGAPSFTKRVSDEIIGHRRSDTALFALFDSTMPEGRQYSYKDYAREHGLTLIDRTTGTLPSLIEKHHIDVFFIPIGQFHADSPLTGIGCKTVMFIHDIFDVERNDNLIDLMLFKDSHVGRWENFKRIYCFATGRWKSGAQRKYDNIMKLYTAPSTVPYTVSAYTRSSLLYFFPELASNPPRVCYSPMKEAVAGDTIENTALRQMVDSGTPYLLMIAADREYKNVQLLLKVFPRLQRDYPGLHLLTLKLGRTIGPHHTDIDFLSDSDLEHAYRHARALVFPSFFEGFGYPPVEAMRQGTPTVAANVTSIPEVVGDAAELFSPFYPADLYRALHQVLDHRDEYRDRMAHRWQELQKTQEEQLQKLVEEVYSDTDAPPTKPHKP